MNNIISKENNLFDSNVFAGILKYFPNAIVIFKINNNIINIDFSNVEYKILNKKCHVVDIIFYLSSYYKKKFNKLLSSIKLNSYKKGVVFNLTSEKKYLGVNISKYRHDDQLYYLALISDISERILYQNNYKLLSKIINNFSSAVLLLKQNEEKKWIVYYANKSFLNLFNYSFEKMLGADFFTFEEIYNKINFKKIKEELKEKDFVKDVTFDTTINNDEITVGLIANKIVLETEEKENFSIVLIMSNITKRIVNQKEINYKKKLLEEKNELIKNMIMTVTHKFNNNISPILTYSELWQKRILKKKEFDTNELLQSFIQINSAATELASFSKKNMDLIKLKKIEKFENISEIKMKSLVYNTLKLFDVMLEQKNKVVYNKLKTTDIVYADEEQIKEVIENFISNFIKYSDSDSELFIESEKYKNDYIKFKFKNKGKPLKEELKTLIFEPYFRLQEDLHKTGNGIGLSVCKNIISNHKGKIGVESYDEGNIFYFTLSCKKDILI